MSVYIHQFLIQIRYNQKTIYIQALVDIIATKAFKTDTFCKYHLDNVIMTLNETKTTDTLTLMILKNIIVPLCTNLEYQSQFDKIIDSIDYLKVKFMTNDADLMM